MSYYEYLNTKLSDLIKAGAICQTSKLVLYPFGEQGMLTKQILNWRYGIKEELICDDGLSRTNSNIKPLNYLTQIDVSQYLVIITSDNILYWDELRENLKKIIDEKKMIDLFPSKPRMFGNNPRVSSLEVAQREIYEKGVAGAVAEAGVHKGDFACYINQLFYDRKMYLFDTFEGFASSDIQTERNCGYSFKPEGFYSDTSVEIVLKKMPFRDNIVIRKGYFPDTAKGIEEQFCFVSLDMDLYQPIKAGLEYFYPRLAKGGYIFVHDCNIGNINYRGARVALLEFCEKNKIGYVMLPDDYCTAVLTKA